MNRFIPHNLSEAVEHIIGEMSEEDRLRFAREPEDHPGAQFHFYGGMNMRNNWGLWYNESPLSKWFAINGIHHGDDRSGTIYKALWCKLNSKTLDIKKEAEYYRQFWERAGIDHSEMVVVGGKKVLVDIKHT